MTAAPATDTIRYAIVEYVTQKSILNVYEALSIDRIQFEAVRYDRAARRSIERAACFVPITKCKVIVHQVLSGLARRPGWKHEIYGGSPRDGQIESRVLTVECDPSDGRFAENPWRITIARGPGKRTATGGIAPDGQPTTRVALRFADDDFQGICLEIRDYLTAHQIEIEDIRRLEQLQHYEAQQRRKTAQPAAQPARSTPTNGQQAKQPAKAAQAAQPLYTTYGRH